MKFPGIFPILFSSVKPDTVHIFGTQISMFFVKFYMLTRQYPMSLSP